MPKGNAYPGPPERLEIYRSLVDRHGETEVKGAKNPYTSRNGWMTSFLDPDGRICFRLSVDDRAAAIDDGASPVEQYGRDMPDFAGASVVAGDIELDGLFSRSWDHAGTLEPK